MAQTVDIYFKVDGVEQYITDLNQLEGALKELNDQYITTANSQDEFADGLDADQLDTVEGSVKVLAGSVEFLAGAFAVAGSADNEFVAAIEENVVGILALGQGIIDTTEGIRLLKENTKLAAAAQKAMNLVANANPYVLLATAILAVASAFAIMALNANTAKEDLEELNKELKDLGSDENLDDINSVADAVGNLSEKAFPDTRTNVEQLDENLTEARRLLNESFTAEQNLADRADRYRQGLRDNELEAYNAQQRKLRDLNSETIQEELTASQARFDELDGQSFRSIAENIEYAKLKQEIAASNFELEIRQEQEKQATLTKALEDGEAARGKLKELDAEATKKQTDATNKNTVAIKDNTSEVLANNQAIAAREEDLNNLAELEDTLYYESLTQREQQEKDLEDEYYNRINLLNLGRIAELEDLQASGEISQEELDELNYYNELKLQAWDQYQQKLGDLKDGWREEDKAKEMEYTMAIADANQQLQDATFAAISGGIGALSALAGENEKAQNALFLIDQAAAAAEVTLNWLKEKAANAAYAATLGPAGPAYLVPANTASNLRYGAAIATIAATTIGKFKGGKGAATGGDDGTGATPDFGAALEARNQQLISGLDSGETGSLDIQGSVRGGEPVIKAYVVASDVTSQQEANQQIENLSRL